MDAESRPKNDPIRVRLVGAPTSKATRRCKSGSALDKILAERPVSAMILAHTALIAGILCNTIAFQDEVARGAIGKKAPPLKNGPIHPVLVAKIIISKGSRLADPLTEPDTAPRRRDILASLIDHLGRDSNRPDPKACSTRSRAGSRRGGDRASARPPRSRQSSRL